MVRQQSSRQIERLAAPVRLVAALSWQALMPAQQVPAGWVQGKAIQQHGGVLLLTDPTQRFGPLPQTNLMTQTEDVLVDARGYIYITDRNQGIWVLRYTGPKSRWPS